HVPPDECRYRESEREPELVAEHRDGMTRMLVVPRMSFVFSWNGGACMRRSPATSLCALCRCVLVMLVAWNRIHRSTPVSHRPYCPARHPGFVSGRTAGQCALRPADANRGE